MKHLILIICLLWPFTTANAGFFSKGPDPLVEAKEKITVLESQIITLENKAATQAIRLDHWQIASGSLAVACVLLLIIGTALGAKTRHHYDSTRRLGRTPSTPPPTSTLNGRKPSILGEDAEENLHQTLAA